MLVFWELPLPSLLLCLLLLSSFAASRAGGPTWGEWPVTDSQSIRTGQRRNNVRLHHRVDSHFGALFPVICFRYLSYQCDGTTCAADRDRSEYFFTFTLNTGAVRTRYSSNCDGPSLMLYIQHNYRVYEQQNTQLVCWNSDLIIQRSPPQKKSTEEPTDIRSAVCQKT